MRPARPAPEARPAPPPRPFFAPPPRWPFVRPSGTLAAGGFGGQWPTRGQAFAAGGFGGAGQPPTAPTHPTRPSAVVAAKMRDLTRNIAQLEKSRIFAHESARIRRGKVLLNSHLTMATMQGITGKLSGKMGSAVFRVREGQQVVTQYNPIVKNPNTTGQQSQRAAFKLMSQLAAIMSPGFGTMSVAKRKAKGGTPSQRNAFTQINFPLVEVESQGQDIKASIPMEQLKLTSSFRPLPPIVLTARQSNEISIEMTGIAADVTTIRVVTVGYKQNVASIVSITDFPVTNQQVNEKLEDLSAGDHTVLAFGLIPSESAKSRIDIDNIHTPEQEQFISAVVLNEMVANGDMLETQTVGANITVIA